MDRNDSVQDNEELYRRVRKNSEKPYRYSYDDIGVVTIHSTAFFDPNKQPSVDRAKLNGFNPVLSKENETDGIVSLIAGEVRAIPIEDHTVDVIYAPISGNSAHSQITITPEGTISNTKQRKAFRTLRKALARLATKRGWTLEPEVN